MTHETWSQGFDGLDAVQTRLSALGTLADVGLTADFQSRGAALRGRLSQQGSHRVFWPRQLHLDRRPLPSTPDARVVQRLQCQHR